MTETISLGTLSSIPVPLEDEPEIAFASFDATDVPDGKKLLAEESKVEPSVWFVNFPDKSAIEEKHALRDFLQDTTNYRTWASSKWWSAVLNHPKVPQGYSPEAIGKRSSFFARYASNHMKKTPWLAMHQENDRTQTFNCKTTEFHTEIIKSVLAGFVDVPLSALKSLEGILDSLSKSMEQSAVDKSDKLVVCERFEYIPQADAIKSYIRLIHFATNNETKVINNAKKKESSISCEIKYSDYEAEFNQKNWKVAGALVDERMRDDMKKFLDNNEIDCDPE
ncbi:uncharacterized protein N7446_005604 [Penicillium canescens]|uniref:Uncharacterized protein n=1 Tax=Penicillium canescens TaxID=5083 RepID=A0AAD6II78_PENCN|nr:uncharacterized protein N7446_005604 [Penicillium canescens]KAJ6050976.1 hypothetical protein N7460_001510 [Penicillium canescens]KAJ6061484.1 hypothetical protein N7446_005604 [Penicillium canescens]